MIGEFAPSKRKAWAIETEIRGLAFVAPPGLNLTYIPRGSALSLLLT